VAINRRAAIQPAFDALLRIVDHVYPVAAVDIERAKTLLMGLTRIDDVTAVPTRCVLRCRTAATRASGRESQLRRHRSLSLVQREEGEFARIRREIERRGQVQTIGTAHGTRGKHPFDFRTETARGEDRLESPQQVVIDRTLLTMGRAVQLRFE